MHLGSLESTREARVTLGYRLEQLLRFPRALQTSRVHPFNHYSAKARVISRNSQPKRTKAELAKIRRYHASLSAIMVL